MGCILTHKPQNSREALGSKCHRRGQCIPRVHSSWHYGRVHSQTEWLNPNPPHACASQWASNTPAGPAGVWGPFSSAKETYPFLTSVLTSHTKPSSSQISSGAPEEYRKFFLITTCVLNKDTRKQRFVIPGKGCEDITAAPGWV